MLDSDAAFLEKIYRKILGRSPEAAGLEHYSSKLARNQIDRAGIVAELADSQEFYLRLADSKPADRAKLILRNLWTLPVPTLLKIWRFDRSQLNRRPDAGVCDQITERLRKTKYFQGAPLPNLQSDYLLFDPARQSDREHMKEHYNIAARARMPGNLLFIHRNARRFRNDVTYAFEGGRNVAVVAEDCRLLGSVTLRQDDNLAVIFGGQHGAMADVFLSGGSIVIWGQHVSAFWLRITAGGGKVCTVGDHCMFSSGITVTTTDDHSVVDLESFEVVNSPADVTIGRHVWIGRDCTLLKGICIGDGSIIGAKSVVTRDVPSKEAWAGAPATCRRRNVSWVRPHPEADPESLIALKQLLDLPP